MTQKHISVFFISLLACVQLSYAQTEELVEEVIPARKDTTQTGSSQYYGLRIGADIAQPLRTLLDENYSGFQIVGDFRIKKNSYLAAEIGSEMRRTTQFANIDNTSIGSYIKAGINFNVYENWFGMNNLIYVGGRAGFSSFRHELNAFTIGTTNPLFGDDTRMDGREFTGLSASWVEFQLGLQTELFANLYLGVNVQLKSTITRTDPEDFTTIFIPGFGRTTDGSRFGVGYGYTLSYLIPIFKK